jgi:multiple sugar transport system permease protein
MSTEINARRKEKMYLGYRIRKTIAFAFRIAVMIFFFLFMVTPILWMISSAFRPVTEIFSSVSPLSWKTFIPIPFTFKNFAGLLFSEGTMWPRYIFNTLFVAISTVVLGGVVNSLAAYGFARMRFPGRDILFILVLITIIIPFEAVALPLYLVIKQLNWLDDFRALIVPAVANAFHIFLLRQFFLGIPRELEEAAIVDGAGPFMVLFRIVIPLSWPAIISTALMMFQMQWQSFIWPLIVTSSPEVRVIQIGISSLIGLDAVYWDVVFAAVALTALVPIIIFLILQRYYMQGIAVTGLKG